MSDPRLLSDDELAAIRKWRDAGGKCVGTGVSPDGYDASATIDAILARNPEPWASTQSDEFVTVNRADLEAVLTWKIGFGAAKDRLYAAITPPPPAWEPSDDDIDAYADCWDNIYERDGVAAVIKEYRAAGWDIVPRRIGDQP